MDDSNSDLAELQIERERARVFGHKGGGASINQDARVSKVIVWFWGIVGTGFIGAVLLVANNLWQLNLAINRLADNGAAFSAQLKDHEDRIRKVERDVSSIEGKVFRGVPGYGADEEPKRGH